ncbi:hypothetical protein [Salibacterium qingdaonense]|uniref:Uncharacterized protein n=1 Tax=Salibacterium qingdaonense TaxID=266892 RepID=A0A1I4QWR5_9BACI|nr:hypothetical protein [Salibacterium qingdaonense]SFM44136.1 hypothetical protein SAMN04488054_1519 [Salibacterium qingdaonense]
MADFEDGSVLVEAVSGKWYRFPENHGKIGTYIIDLPNGFLLAVNVSNKMVEMLIPDENGVYKRAGDLSFRLIDGQASVDLFSESLKEINLDNTNGKIDNSLTDITRIQNVLDLSQSQKWWDKRSQGW